MFKNYLKKQFPFIAVFAVHLLVIFLVLPRINNNETPVLSFSISVNNDVVSSPNNISATSIATSLEPIKKQEKEIVKKDENGEQNKAESKQVKKQLVPQGKIENLVDSKQQSAVFSDQTPASFEAAYLQNPAPKYPPLSRRMNEQGLVLLSVWVNTSGKADKVVIKKSSGFSRLDSAAIDTVQNWRFVPAKQGSQILASEVQVPINFILEK